MRQLLVIMHGTTGAGKSHQAERIAERLGAVLVQTAVERVSLGIGSELSPTEARHFTQSSRSREQVYAVVAQKVDGLLMKGREVVVLDGAYESKAKRSYIYEIAERYGAFVVCVYCHCPRDLAVRRIQSRQIMRDVRAVDEARDIEILNNIEAGFEHPFGDRDMYEDLVVVDINTMRMAGSVEGGSARPPAAEELLRTLHDIGFTFGKRRLHLGLDFDGVIVDTCAAKRRYAYSRFGVRLDAHDCLRERGTRRLGAERYESMVRDIYGTSQTRELNPMDGAIDAIRMLDEVADCYIVTARYHNEVVQLQSWLADHPLPVHGVVHTSEGPKAGVANNLGLDWLIDDSYRNANGVAGVKRFALFDVASAHGDDVPVGTVVFSAWSDIARYFCPDRE